MSVGDAIIALCSAFGVVAFASAALRVANVSQTIGLALDFWMAAGLIRLSNSPGWSTIATAAVLIGIRKLTTTKFTAGVTQLRVIMAQLTRQDRKKGLTGQLHPAICNRAR